MVSWRALASAADVATLSALVRVPGVEALHRADLPYRLCSWALDWPENTALWHDAGGALLAWACRSDAAAALFPEMLLWADGRARAIAGTPAGHPSWFVMVFDDMRERMRELEDAGWACQSDVPEDPWSEVRLERPAGLALAGCSLPPGF
ncbi:MAG: hypothetical protein ACYCYF_13185, partial [Anaerolineae bacterium]